MVTRHALPDDIRTQTQVAVVMMSLEIGGYVALRERRIVMLEKMPASW